MKKTVKKKIVRAKAHDGESALEARVQEMGSLALKSLSPVAQRRVLMHWNVEFPWAGDFFEKVTAKGLEKRTRKNVEKLARGGKIFQRHLEKVGELGREASGYGLFIIPVASPIQVLDGWKGRIRAKGGMSKQVVDTAPRKRPKNRSSA